MKKRWSRNFKLILLVVAAIWLVRPPFPAFALSKPQFPVILIHGIASDAYGSWGLFSDLLINEGWTFGGTPTYDPATGEVTGIIQRPGGSDFYAMNFSDYNVTPCNPLILQFCFNSQNLTLAQQGIEVDAVIRAVLQMNSALDRVILVGHSMGGLAARAYLQSFDVNQYHGNIYKLITVGTPHRGTEIAIICQSFLNVCLGTFKIDPQSVAVAELRPDSASLLALNNLTANPLPNDVHYTSIIGAGTDVIAVKPTQDGDGIVPVSSQDLVSGLAGAGGLLHESATIFIGHRFACDWLGSLFPLVKQTHTCETSDQHVWDELLRQLGVSTGTGDLDLFIKSTPDPVKGGELITYTYTVANRGGADLSGVVLSTLVPELTHVDASAITGGGGCGGGGCNSGNRVTWNLDLISAGQSRTVQMAARVRSQFELGGAPPDGTIIFNSARVVDSSGNIAVAEREVVVDNAPVLTLAMVEDREPVEPGGLLTYTLLFGNPSTVSAPNTTLSASVPAGTAFISSSDGVAPSNGVLTWLIGTLGGGGSGRRQFTVQVGAGLVNGSVLLSEAEIRDASTPQNNARASEATAVRSVGSSPLTLSLTATPDPVKGGELITYTYTVANRGGTDLTGVVLSTLVPELTHVDASAITGGGGCGGGGCNSGNRVTWNLDLISAGQSRTVQMAARVRSQFELGGAPPDGTIIFNSASVTNSSGTIAVAGRSVIVDSTPVLTLAMTESREPVEPGGLLTYTLLFGNPSTASAPNTTLSATVPAGTAFISASEGVAPSNGVLTWLIGTLGGGGSGRREFTVQVGAGLVNGSVLLSEAEIHDASTPQNNARASEATAVRSVGSKSIDVVINRHPRSCEGWGTYHLHIHGSEPRWYGFNRGGAEHVGTGTHAC